MLEHTISNSLPEEHEDVLSAVVLDVHYLEAVLDLGHVGDLGAVLESVVAEDTGLAVKLEIPKSEALSFFAYLDVDVKEGESRLGAVCAGVYKHGDVADGADLAVLDLGDFLVVAVLEALSYIADLDVGKLG